jgi:hypothetical protein
MIDMTNSPRVKILNKYRAIIEGKTQKLFLHMSFFDGTASTVFKSHAQKDGKIYTLDVTPTKKILTWITLDSALTECERCNGTGEYRWGAVINGRSEHSGECYHCGGKGKQNLDDKIRCHNYSPKERL